VKGENTWKEQCLHAGEAFRMGRQTEGIPCPYMGSTKFDLTNEETSRRVGARKESYAEERRGRRPTIAGGVMTHAA